MKYFKLLCFFSSVLITVSLEASNFDTINEVVLVNALPKTDEKNFSHTVLGDIERIIKGEGAEVVRAKSAYYVRDAKVATATGDILRTTDLVNETQAKTILTRIKNREKYLKNNHASYATKHSAFAGNALGTGIKGLYHRRAADGYSNSSHNSFYDSTSAQDLATSSVYTFIKPSRSVLEGGNVLLAKNTAGVSKILIGEETLLWTHYALRINGFFKPKNEQSSTPFMIEEKDPSGSFTKYKDLVNQQWLKGEIFGRVAQLGIDQNLTDEQYLQIGNEMNAVGLLRSFKNELSLELKTFVDEYIGQREYIKQILWPMEFSISKDDILVIPQAAYHLDVFMTLGPKGAVFIQDFGATIDYLTNLLCYSIEPASNLNNQAREIINSYLDSALELKKDLGPIYQKVHQLLTAAGFTIIKTPGAFYGFDKKKSVNVNFMNALSGWSAKNNRSYYVCLGAQIGENNKLGLLMMEGFEKFLRRHITDVKVHFVGARDKDFSAAMHFNNSGKSLAGVHCMTYELKRNGLTW